MGELDIESLSAVTHLCPRFARQLLRDDLFPALSGALRLFFLFFFFSTALLLLHCFGEAEPVFTFHRPMFDATRNSQKFLFDSSLADRSPCRLGLGGISCWLWASWLWGGGPLLDVDMSTKIAEHLLSLSRSLTYLAVVSGAWIGGLLEGRRMRIL